MLLPRPNLNKPAFLIFPKMKDDIKNNLCTSCGSKLLGESEEFKDDVSRNEYSISGMCQACQDIIFNDLEE